MNPLDELAKRFSYFPGIGERQAKRFVYYLLKQDQQAVTSLVDLIKTVKKGVTECARCHRFESGMKGEICSRCEKTKGSQLLMVIEKDTDLEAMERSHAYEGSYFVLGGLVPILEKEPERRVRLAGLKKLLSVEKTDITEIIFALSFTREGEYTDEFLRAEIMKWFPDNTWKLSTLGKGLSTGTELEYADKETLAGALQHRSEI